MWSTIANLKENLNKMAQDVHDEDDEDEEFEIYASLNGAQASSISDRRNSHSFAHSKSPSRSPIPNGIDSFINPEVWHCFYLDLAVSVIGFWFLFELESWDCVV